MDSPALLLLALLSAGTLLQVRGLEAVTALYGETIVVPCNSGAPPPEGLMFTKWKYKKDDSTQGDLLVKQANKGEVTVQATDEYALRVSIANNYSLLISQGSLKDQRIFTCIVVSDTNIMEYPIVVVVNKKPSSPEIMDTAEMLVKDKLTMLGTCIVKDANPAAEITWTKNGQPMAADGKAVVVSPSVKVDPATGLSTTSSTLQYTATKADIGASFTCLSTHLLAKQESAPETFAIHYPTPVITSLTKHRTDDAKHKVLTCEAEGVPEPSFQWSVNGTHEESSYINGKATYKITVTPKVNMTVTCRVSNRLGEDVMTINVSSLFKEDTEIKGSLEEAVDQAKLIVGIVAGLLLAAAVVGLIYLLYVKNSRQGS